MANCVRILAATTLLTLLLMRGAVAWAVDGPTAYQPTIFGYDKGLPLSPEEQPGKDGSGYRQTKISYTSANNLVVPAILMLPADVKEGDRLPCIVMMHGLGGSKTDLGLLWPAFVKAGYAIFSIDAQFHGERKPKTPIDLFGTSVYSTRNMLIQTVVDLRRGIDYLETRKEIDPNRIGYAGFSMGGILGTMLAAVDPRVQAPVLALAGGDWKLMFASSKLPAAEKARLQNPDAAAAGLDVLDPVDPIHWVARIAPRPILFVNGDHDSVVPVVSGKALQDAAGPTKEIFMYKGDHVPSFAEFPKVVEKMISWLNTNLKDRKQ